MKKTLLSIALLAMAFAATAQDTIDLSTSNDIVRFNRRFNMTNPRDHQSFTNWIPYAIRLTTGTSQPIPIYGLVMAYNFVLESKAILHPTLIQKEGDIFVSHSPDSLDYANHPRAYDCYIHVDIYPDTSSSLDCSEFGHTDTTYGAYKFYYDTPIMADTFYVGFYLTGDPYGNGDSLPFVSCDCEDPDAPDRLWNADFIVNSDGTLTRNSHCDGFCNPIINLIIPLLTPPDSDNFSCPPVEAFNLVGIDAGYPTFLMASDEGVDWYEVAYGPYDQPIDSLHTDTTSSTVYVLTDPSISPTVYYQARCRTRCRHACPVHDTVMYTPWSAPVYFYTGDSMPDTTHTHQGITLANSHAPRFTLTPNPTRKQVTVQIENGELNANSSVGGDLQSPTEIVLRDAAGHEVLRQALHSPLSVLHLEALPAGVYFATLYWNGSPASTQRLVIRP